MFYSIVGDKFFALMQIIVQEQFCFGVIRVIKVIKVARVIKLVQVVLVVRVVWRSGWSGWSQVRVVGWSEN